MAENQRIAKQNSQQLKSPETPEEKEDVFEHKFTIGSVTVLTFLLGLQVAGLYNWITSQPRKSLHNWYKAKKQSKVEPEVKSGNKIAANVPPEVKVDDEESTATIEDQNGDQV